jgi:hypothetical protein
MVLTMVKWFHYYRVAGTVHNYINGSFVVVDTNTGNSFRQLVTSSFYCGICRQLTKRGWHATRANPTMTTRNNEMTLKGITSQNMRIKQWILSVQRQTSTCNPEADLVFDWVWVKCVPSGGNGQRDTTRSPASVSWGSRKISWPRIFSQPHMSRQLSSGVLRLVLW